MLPLIPPPVCPFLSLGADRSGICRGGCAVSFVFVSPAITRRVKGRWEFVLDKREHHEGNAVW